MSSIIRLDKLKKEYPVGKDFITALSDINLEIEAGEIFGIIGASGAGKSTLVRCLNLLEKPSDGHVYFEDVDLATLGAKELNKARQSISMIFQQFNLFPHLTIMDNITLAPVLLKKMTKEEADAEEAKGNYVTEENGAYRRVIAAPQPIDIYEIEAVRTLLDAGQIVIAGGGGGIPVLQQGTRLKGASAIIEKDYTAAKLAELLGAGTLLFLTAYDKLTIGAGTSEERVFDKISASELKKYIDAGHFPAVTTFPKVDASIRFVSAFPDSKAVIANLEKSKEGLAGKSGTTITA